MEKRKSSAAASKVKKKMTKEQMQLAITKKKECDAKALKIVEHLLEPNIDSVWLLENLKDINRCHMEDVIEERAIVKLCGYILCQKPLTVVYNQRYHISLKDKKVYDVTKRKNFCSSNCFSASNYLLEQMLTSPLWLRHNEEIPNFRIFHNKKQGVNNFINGAHEVQVNIMVEKNCNQKEAKENIESKDFNIIKDDQSERRQNHIEADKKIEKCIENFILETPKGINNDNIIQQYIYPTEKPEQETNQFKSKWTSRSSEKNQLQSDNEIQQCSYSIKEKINETNGTFDLSISNEKIVQDIVSDKLSDSDNLDDCNLKKNYRCAQKNEMAFSLNSDVSVTNIVYSKEYSQNNTTLDSNSNKKLTVIEDYGEKKTNTSKSTKRKKQAERLIDINYAVRVEKSFHEWITEETKDYLFGDECIKQKAIDNIGRQDKHSILCEKLHRLQFQDNHKDDEVSNESVLKPAPHFDILKEEGKKLDIKVRAFYEGKTTFEQLSKSNADNEVPDVTTTFLPLTDGHAPQILRRKIFLEKLNHVLPELIRTLAGNNDFYIRTSLNYTSATCTAVKALIHTFSLSAKNIIFKTAEWTLVGLVIIKMLSLSDPCLASLLATKQANLYVSMILTAYKLNPDYLSLLVSSFNPNVNPR